MVIEILGPGCYRCVQTVQVVQRALEELGKRPGEDVLIQKVEDIRAIAQRRVLTPAVAIDGRIVCQGKIPTLDEAKSWLAGGAR
jgi:small redox-active disulfide protein 2